MPKLKDIPFIGDQLDMAKWVFGKGWDLAGEEVRKAWIRGLVAAVGIVLAAHGAAWLIPILQASPMVADIIDKARKVKEAVDEVQEKVKEIENRIREVISLEEIQQTIDYARAFNMVATLTSSDYRNFKADLFRRTAEVSRSVFQDSTAILSGMQLLRLAVYDVTRLRNEPIDMAEINFFGSSLELLEMVNDKSRDYQRTPGNFWADLDERFLTPLAREGDNATRANRAEMSLLRNSIAFLDALAQGVNTRFSEYVVRLSPFLSTQKLREIERIRIDYREKVEKPLGHINDFMQETWPEERDKINLAQEALVILAKDGELMSEIVADPNNLELATRLAQRKRFRQILESAWTILPDSSALASEAQRELEAELTGGN